MNRRPRQKGNPFFPLRHQKRDLGQIRYDRNDGLVRDNVCQIQALRSSRFRPKLNPDSRLSASTEFCSVFRFALSFRVARHPSPLGFTYWGVYVQQEACERRGAKSVESFSQLGKKFQVPADGGGTSTSGEALKSGVQRSG